LFFYLFEHMEKGLVTDLHALIKNRLSFVNSKVERSQAGIYKFLELGQFKHELLRNLSPNYFMIPLVDEQIPVSYLHNV
jgi:hypothetical protein